MVCESRFNYIYFYFSVIVKSNLISDLLTGGDLWSTGGIPSPRFLPAITNTSPILALFIFFVSCTVRSEAINERILFSILIDKSYGSTHSVPTLP